MPALTVPDPPSQDDPPVLPSARDFPNPYPRPSPPRPQRLPPADVVYSHARFDSSGSPLYYDRVYSPLFPSQFPSPPPSSSMFGHFVLPQAQANWQPHITFLHHNPSPLPQPPQVVHKVWILDCRSCGTFLTNRGMKAVLLLRPNVSLYSTDALPVNCSAYSSNPDALRLPSCRSSAVPSSPRTCECLTQTLCCHTCGTAVGYMIVIPCARCTSTISATNRATNGHRFVFHSSEIMASERHYIPDEPGVFPVGHTTPPPPPSSPPPLAPAYPAIFHPADVSTYRPPGSSMPSQPFQSLETLSSSSPDSEYHLSPRMESPDLAPSSVHSSPQLLASIPPTSPRRSPRPSLQTPFPHNSPPQTLLETRGAIPETIPRKLKAGDIVYWHHLTKHGEIPGVQEDPRARLPNWRDARDFFER